MSAIKQCQSSVKLFLKDAYRKTVKYLIRHKNQLKILVICFFAWSSATALFMSPILNGEGFLHGSMKEIKWALIFGILAAIYMKAVKIGSRRERNTAVVISLVFSVLFTIGNELEHKLDLSGLFSIFGFFKLFISIIGFTALFSSLMIWLFEYLGQIDFNRIKPSKIWFTDNRRSFFTVWAVIFLCWLPYIIIFNPGFLNTDSAQEFAMGVGTVEFSAHHTIIHTLMMSAFIRLGNLLGLYSLGALLYSLTQMIIMSAIFSFALRYLAYRNAGQTVRFLVFAYFALYPVNALYSMTGWKDVIFGGLCLMLFLFIIEIFRRPKTMLFSKTKIAATCAVAILFTLFRNNAVYALVLFLPFLLLSMRKYWKRLILVAVICTITVSVFNWCAYHVFGIDKPDVGEAMSVPLQQIARTVTYHQSELTQTQTDSLSRYVLVDELPRLYNPRLSDPVKFNAFNRDAFHDNMSGFIKIWIELGIKYFGEYVESFLYNSYGYWFPDTDYWVYTYEQIGVGSVELISPGQKQSVSGAIDFLVGGLPALSMLSSVGFMVWVIVFSVGVMIINRKKNLIVPVLLPGFLWFTTLASPVYAEYRYVYGVMLCAPVIFVLSALKTKETPIQKAPFVRCADTSLEEGG